MSSSAIDYWASEQEKCKGVIDSFVESKDDALSLSELGTYFKVLGEDTRNYALRHITHRIRAALPLNSYEDNALKALGQYVFACPKDATFHLVHGTLANTRKGFNSFASQELKDVICTIIEKSEDPKDTGDLVLGCLAGTVEHWGANEAVRSLDIMIDVVKRNKDFADEVTLEWGLNQTWQKKEGVVSKAIDFVSTVLECNSNLKDHPLLAKHGWDRIKPKRNNLSLVPKKETRSESKPA